MDTILKRSTFHPSEKTKKTLIEIVVLLFILLFVYTAVSKITTFKSFNTVLSRSVLIGSYSKFTAWFVVLSELSISTLLMIPKTQKTGLWASLALMVVFTLYLLYMVITGSKTTCHCGGVITEMSWTQHIFFNVGFILLAILGIRLKKE